MRSPFRILAISLAFALLAGPASANEPLRHVEDATLRSAFFIDQ